MGYPKILYTSYTKLFQLKLKSFDWKKGGFVIGYHIFLLIALPIYFYYHTPSLKLIIISIVIFFLTGISITAGYHRFYSHKAYHLNKYVEAVVLFFATMSVEGSALAWSNDHRIHHRFTDKEEDPHSIKKGFFYAHMLWLFEKTKPIDEKNVADLMQNKIVMFQHKYYGILSLTANLAIFVVVVWLTNDYIGAFLLALLTRIFLLHHFTWFINSLAHTWGERTFSREQSAVDNYVIALLTFGEGYHNYHHVFASDYRNGIKWYHFDPTKWLIWVLNKFSLAAGLKKMSSYIIKKRIVMEDKSILLEKIRASISEKKDALERKVHEMSEQINSKISRITQLINEYRESRKRETYSEIKLLKRGLRQDWTLWCRLCRDVMRLT